MKKVNEGKWSLRAQSQALGKHVAAEWCRMLVDEDMWVDYCVL
jgi:hypothetical protein